MLYPKEKQQKNIDKYVSKLAIGDEVLRDKIIATEKQTKPPLRYSESMLIKELEKKEIGRPSTYSQIITKIQDPKRDYVRKETREGKPYEYYELVLIDKSILRKQLTGNLEHNKNKLFPTDTGKMVNQFLSENFDNIFNYQFTAEVETKLDKISNGDIQWNLVVDNVYKLFSPIVKKLSGGKVTSYKNNKKKLLGKTSDNQPIYAYLGKYGALVQKGEKDSEECQYAGLLKEQTLDTITLKDAMKLLSYPKELGLINRKKVIIKRGRYGFYIQHGSNTCSLDKECDVDSLTIKNIKQYLTDNQDKVLGTYKNKDIYLKTGKYGPYIQYQKKNYSIKNNTITLEEAIEIVQYPKKIGTHEKKQIVLAKGKYGYYLQYQKKNYSLGKIDPKSITLKTAITIINTKTSKKTSKK